jgi:hypothetical protein
MCPDVTSATPIRHKHTRNARVRAPMIMTASPSNECLSVATLVLHHFLSPTSRPAAPKARGGCSPVSLASPNAPPDLALWDGLIPPISWSNAPPGSLGSQPAPSQVTGLTVCRHAWLRRALHSRARSLAVLPCYAPCVKMPCMTASGIPVSHNLVSCMSPAASRNALLTL